MCDNFHTWQNVLVQWANCLALQDTPIQQIKELGDGRFFHNLLNVISNKAKHSINTDQVNEEVTTFLRYEYPHYCMDAESCEVEDVVEITYITSLLLLHCVLRSQNKRVMDQMYNLDNEIQVSIKNFFEIVLHYEGNVTRSALKHAISEYGNNTSPKVTEKGEHCSESPLIGFSTPKRPPIKDVVESPLAQKLKQVSEQRAAIKRLNNELELEQMEKVEMQEELRQQHEKTKKLAKQLVEKNEEIKKLREEWLYSNYEEHTNGGCGKSCQEVQLKNEIKSLETYVSSVHVEMDALHKERDLLQQRLSKAEHQYNVWHTKSEEYEAQCEKLQHSIVEKELELAHVKELCSDLQSHVQRLKEVRDISVEDDSFTIRTIMSPQVFRTAENLGQVVVDLQLHEKEEENKTISEQLKKMIMEEEERTKCISDLELRLKAASSEAGSLKTSNLELERKVDKMATLQLELEESERKLNSASIQLDHLCQERTLLEKELAVLQDHLASKDNELSESHNTAQSLTSDLTELQDKFLETQKDLTAEVEHVARLELESQETRRQLECRSQEFAVMKTENVEAKQNLDSIEQLLGENVKQAEEMLLLSEDTSGNAEQLREDRIQESLSASCLSVKGKIQRLNFLLTELNVKNLKSLYEQSNLESSCKQLNEGIIKLREEIAELEEKERKHLVERSMLEECLQRADENISVLQTKMLEYTHKIQDLNTVLEDKKVVVERLERVKQSLSDENEKLEKLGEEKAEKLQKVETELAVVKQDKILVQDQYSTIKEFSEEQTKIVNALNCKIAELEKKIQDIVQERDFSNNNLQNLISKLQELQASKENLEQIYNNAMQENKELIDKLNGHANILKDRINELENKDALADKEIEYLKENVAELSKNRDILKLQYDTESQEKEEQIELLSQHVRKLETTVVELEEEKKVVVGELRCVKLNLSETVTKNEKLNEHLLEKEEYVKNFRTTMENELTRLEHENNTVNSALKIVKAELLEVTATKDEIEMSYEKQNEDYKIKFTNLTDNLTSLASEIQAMEQEKMGTQIELQSKTDELTAIKRSYETLLEGKKQLEATNEKQLEQLKMSIKRVEELARENKIITEELNIASSELSKEKQCKELLSEELSRKNNNLVSLVQESDNLHNVVKILEEERNLLQNTVQRLTTEVMNVEASKDKLMQVYSTSETEKEKIVAVRMELEIKMDRLEKEKASINNDLCAARSDLALHKEQQENIIVAHNKKIEEKEDTITQLMRKASLLQDEGNSLEAERNDLCTQLQTVNSELSKLKTCQEHESQLCNKMEAENEALKLEKISLDKKIEEFLQEKNSIIKELDTLRVLVLELQESKVLLLEQHSKELHEMEEKIDGLLKDKAALQNLLDQTTEELNILNRNLQLSESELLEVKRSQDELLEAHTKQIQETEENIMSAHRNAVEVKAVLLKKVEEVEGERDMEKTLRSKVELLLNEEKKNMESVLSQMNELMTEKKIISRLCSDFKDNVCSLRVTIAALQEQNIHKKEEADNQLDNQEIVISTSERFDGMNKESEQHETESLCVLYDSKKKLPAKPWNLDPIIDLVNVRNDNEQGSDNILSENTSGLQNLRVEAHVALDAKPAAMKIIVPVMQAEDEDKTGTNLSEAVNKLECLNAELDFARTEIMGVLKSNDNLRNELSGTEKKCNDMMQEYTNLAIKNGILKSENEELLKNIKELEYVKSLLDRSERDLTTELNTKAELRTEKDTLEVAYGVLKGDFEKLNKDNETLNTTVDITNNKIASLHKQNLELNEKLQKYEIPHLKCEEECWKLVRIREERELEFKKLIDSETSLKQKMFDFRSSLKDLNYKFETLVSGTPISCKELRVIERQRIELEELFTLMDIESEEISQSILNCTYDSLKQAEKNIENQCLLLGIAVHLAANEQPETDLNSERENECYVAGSIEIENKKDCQELDIIQLQISTLISGIEIAAKKCISVDAQCNQILEIYKTKTESAHTLNHRSVFGNVRGLSLKDRTNLIKDIVTKLQGSEKKEAELEMEEDGWNPEDLLEIDSAKKVSQKEHDMKEASQQSSILKMRLRLEQELAQKTEEIEHLNTQNTSLQAMLQEEQNLKAEINKNLTELRVLHGSLADDKEIECKLKSAEEQKCLQLELELQKTSEIKQAYETLLEVNYKLQMENDDMKSKIEEKMKAIRQEYEKKLDRLKAKMRVLYEEEMEKKMKKSKEEIEHFQEMCRLYKDKIESYENDVGILKSQVWEIGDKLLMSEREKKKLEEDLSKQQIFLQSIGKQDYFAERRETLSNLERGRKFAGSSREIPTMDIIDESITFVRRKKNVSRPLPSGMGLMFDPEDEEGEVFNTTNLADLKEGRCVPRDYKGRISELQYRNSLCPPHLKSSYPAETQFHHPQEYKDDDLKLGCAVDVDQCDALSTSLLLPSEKQRKKDRGQGTEVLTPRAPLRESNDGACVRKASTPSRLKSLFTNKNRRDENTPVTPRGRRLSNIFRRQVKGHQ